VPGYDSRLVDDDGKVIATPGEMGELQVRGPTSAMMYWNNRVQSRLRARRDGLAARLRPRTARHTSSDAFAQRLQDECRQKLAARRGRRAVTGACV
jgi:acyl-CoA synthetase (AMP-forming)/AMP-acid ligase II